MQIMEINKTIVFKGGHYSLNPQDAEKTVMNVPEDSVFVTGGQHDIGTGLHIGAVHMLMITKATDDEIEAVLKQCFNAHIVNYCLEGFQYVPFRLNGYGFIYFTDLIPVEGIEFTDTDRFNELLGLTSHPLYTVLFNKDSALCAITRIDRIESYYKLKCQTIQLYSILDSRWCPKIIPNSSYTLHEALTPFHELHQYFPDEEYGKELFDEAMYTVLMSIYPEFGSKLIGYDLDYTKHMSENFAQKYGFVNKLVGDSSTEKDTSQQVTNCLEEFMKMPSELSDYDDFMEIMSLKKKLPKPFAKVLEHNQNQPK